MNWKVIGSVPNLLLIELFFKRIKWPEPRYELLGPAFRMFRNRQMS
jgi:parallel beta-helix repeat protein